MTHGRSTMRGAAAWLAIGLALGPVLAFPADPAAGMVPGGARVPPPPLTGPVRIAYLHHSTGRNVWDGGVAAFIQEWNRTHGTDYRITEITYPSTTRNLPILGKLPHRVRDLLGVYPWANYPYDYWNLWVAHTGSSRDRGEWNLDDLAKDFDVIVFKHCFPVSGVKADDGKPDVASPEKTLANYQLQYQALKERMRQFPGKRFVAWTGAALTEGSTRPEDAARAQQFFDWVKGTWDEKGDNVFVWDFRALETEGGLYLRPELAAGARDSHPNPTLAARAAPAIGQRIVDVIEGRGDTGTLTGR